MARIEDFIDMLSDLSRFGSNIEVVERGSTSGIGPEAARLVVRLYTDTNRYQIVAISDGREGYLGCQGSSRKPRAGERHCRGRDLSDGPLNRRTWHQILASIVSFEMVSLSKEARTLDAGPAAPTESIRLFADAPGASVRLPAGGVADILG
ncbi:hypothetical protein [Falsiroseomonas sp. CW058]|uniref:hypothetical protein n=1 Tax=Falsiroseomonas sp. CW058 TaxID=3388664 RepID=UPI003D3170E0